MMNRTECFRILARHIKDEAVVSTYSSAFEWDAINPRDLNYFSIGAMGLDTSHALGLALSAEARVARDAFLSARPALASSPTCWASGP